MMTRVIMKECIKDRYITCYCMKLNLGNCCHYNYITGANYGIEADDPSFFCFQSAI